MQEQHQRPAIARAIAWVGVLLCGGAAMAADHIAPVVPGYVRLRDEAKAPATELGTVLLGELNCTSCHAAPGAVRISAKGAPDLANAGSRLTPQYIRAYLLDNHGMKPGSTMPDLFHASEPQSKEGAVDYLTHYLVSLGGPIKPSGEEVNVLLPTIGKKLFHNVGCVACHAPDGKSSTTIPSIPLPNLASKTTVEQLTAFLLDPSKVRPGGRMPSLNLAPEEAHAIAIYLLRDQLENPQSKTADPARRPGTHYIYYELQKSKTAALAKIKPLRPKSQGEVDNFTPEIPKHRGNNFAILYNASIRIPKDGEYTFTTHSDDGSMLYIDDQLVVDNDGIHPPGDKSGKIKLQEGDHPITVTFLQEGGGYELRVEWEGPGFKRREIRKDDLYVTGGRPMVPLNSEPFAVDPQKARMGAMMFNAIGCVSCHTIPGGKAMRERKALAELNVDSPAGCLGEQVAKISPNYYLSADQRDALKAAIKAQADLAKPYEPKQLALHMAATFNCVACHVRDNAGGPTSDRQPYFVMTAEFDMGDEGRIAPRLTNVGAKLTADSLNEVIFHDKLHIRPVLATRMPSFNQEKVGPIVDAFVKADAPVALAEPKFDAAVAREGRTLFGNKGLGCVNCHGVNGVKSLGMPAPDMGTAHQRLQYSWFHDLMKDPTRVNPATRMPGFWPNGDVAFKNIAGGTVDSQIAALWMYLSLGQAMPLPTGLAPSGGDELVPTDSPIVHRTFFQGAGNRSIAVGFPEMVHVVFDADVVRLAKAWKGRFFDAKGMWVGRGGNHLGPLGTDVIDLPAGPSFAVLAAPDAVWPLPKDTFRNQVERNLGGHFKGYVLDKDDRPTFHYILDAIDIQEQPLPVLKTGGANLARRFVLSSKSAAKGLYFLAAQGKEISPAPNGAWIVDGKLTLSLQAGAAGLGSPVIRESAGAKQLLIPVNFDNAGSAHFTVEMSW